MTTNTRNALLVGRHTSDPIENVTIVAQENVVFATSRDEAAAQVADLMEKAAALNADLLLQNTPAIVTAALMSIPRTSWRCGVGLMVSIPDPAARQAPTVVVETFETEAAAASAAAVARAANGRAKVSVDGTTVRLEVEAIIPFRLAAIEWFDREPAPALIDEPAVTPAEVEEAMRWMEGWMEYGNGAASAWHHALALIERVKRVGVRGEAASNEQAKLVEALRLALIDAAEGWRHAGAPLTGEVAAIARWFAERHGGLPEGTVYNTDPLVLSEDEVKRERALAQKWPSAWVAGFPSEERHPAFLQGGRDGIIRVNDEVMPREGAWAGITCRVVRLDAWRRAAWIDAGGLEGAQLMLIRDLKPA